MKRSKNTDPAHDVLRYERQPLNAIFRPETVAVIGATDRPGSVGRTLVWNLIANPFGGTVYPVNPRAARTCSGSRRTRPSPTCRRPVDLAVVVAPAPAVPGIIAECVEAGVEGAIIISAGFKETGAEGAELERAGPRGGPPRPDADHRAQLPRRHEPHDRPERHLRRRTWPGPATSPSSARAARSCTAILDWSFRENVGFSAFVSSGSMLDVGWGDLIDYLGDDPKTQSIVIYMESIGDARVVPLGRPRGGADQADHRDQGRPHRGRREGRRLAHRLADRQRRGARRRLPAQRRAARRRHLRPVLHGRGPRQAAAPEGPAPDHPDQRRRPGGAGDRRPDRRRRRSSRELSPETMDGARRDPPRPLEPRQPDRHPRRRRPRALREGARDRRRRPRAATACSSSSRRRP